MFPNLAFPGPEFLGPAFPDTGFSYPTLPNIATGNAVDPSMNTPPLQTANNNELISHQDNGPG